MEHLPHEQKGDALLKRQPVKIKKGDTCTLPKANPSGQGL